MHSEYEQKFEFNKKEIIAIFKTYYSNLTRVHQKHLRDNALSFYLKTGDNEELKKLVRRWLTQDKVNKVSVFDRDYKLLLQSFNYNGEQIEEHINSGDEPVYLSEEFVKSIGTKKNHYVLNISGNRRVEFISFSKIMSSGGELVGYLKEVLNLERRQLKAKLSELDSSKMIIFKEGQSSKIVTDLNFLNYKVNKWKPVEIVTVQDTKYEFKKFNINWGDDWLSVYLGDSKKNYNLVLNNILTSFMSVMFFLVVILVILAFVISMYLLKPLKNLIDVIKDKDPGEELIKVPVKTGTELGILSEKFNELFKKIFNSQKKLKTNIETLEDVNNEIKDTQTKLVHNEKMASLGQLVAGVAHELNNPIGFIYSNMGHLREYANQLINIIEKSEQDPEKIKQLKEDGDYEFILEDLPKLIQSCEDGAKRTRDIVLGLRNFSRIEEAKLKEVDVTEGIDRTLDLLKGELKSKINVTKKYAKSPNILCYPSQLNQVFMNIISNAIHAIEGRGELTISTQVNNDKTITISFKDSGKGMDQETAEKVFDPFFTTKDVGQGTGLGLSISYGIIQKHDGQIDVKSKLGEGTEFTITLPIEGPKNIEEPTS